MSRNLKRIRLSSERALLSDTLPYEVPITFSNHGMYEFFTKNRVELRDDSLVWKRKSIAEEILVKIAFGVDFQVKAETIEEWVGEKKVKLSKIPKALVSTASKPYNFSIKHKEDSFRTLSVPHPAAQAGVVWLYKRYAQSIIYHCDKSKFSIRRPVRVASRVFFDDDLNKKRRDSMQGLAEQSGLEYASLRSFFVYKKYNNIYKFYESQAFHDSEKRFNKLLKLDVSKCFDSIYTHSITWAIFGKESIKRQFLGSEVQSAGNSFPDHLDRHMQGSNSRETNGILIGPEFSRIFAELIFQTIDVNVLGSVSATNESLRLGEDFKIYRYIDDYFLFYNEERTRDLVVSALAGQLSEYNMHLSEEKAVLYEKPIITAITIAKNQISVMFADQLQIFERNGGAAAPLSLKLNAEKAITEIKSIIKTSGVSYRDVQNWTLALLENRLEQALKAAGRDEFTESAGLQLGVFLKSVFRFLFFVYSVSPRVNTTVRMCRIINLALRGADLAGVGANTRHALRRQVFEDVSILLRRTRVSGNTQIETMYLVLQIAELGKQFQLKPNDLLYAFGFDEFSSPDLTRLDHFSLTTLMFYMKDRKSFHQLRSEVVETISNRIESAAVNDELLWNSEAVFLLLDSLGCPYIPNKSKSKMLKVIGVSSSYSRKKLLELDQQWFTRWRNFDFAKQLDAKRSLEVY